jgi:hypothetical protein
MTLMQVGNSEGVRRCDERCYGAEGGVCACCCGGLNHGAGLNRAIDNTRAIAAAWVAAGKESDAYFAPEARQVDLFGGCQ